MAEATCKPLRRSPPITRNPLFPAIVALWFAALLALGSFALRISMIETVVVTVQIDRLFPAASPPLGVTARLLVALALGMTGAAIGWFLARRMARTPDTPVRDVFNVAKADLDLFPARAEPAFQTRMPMPASAAPSAVESIASADLAKLSHVELIERLAIALQQRSDWREPAPAEPAAEWADPVSLPRFAELRSARLAARPMPPSPVETEKVLRDALVGLQRMRGAA